MQHAHHEWLTSVGLSIADDYDRLRADVSASPGNIQQVGHGAESSWVRFLREWLPPGYEIGRRKYILPEEGEQTFETDLVVFDPSYPSALREQERILASGVAAAFSVKLTAEAAGLREAAEAAAQLSRGLKPRIGTPRSEMLRPFPYAYLAHSHSWKAPTSTPTANITQHLETNEYSFCAHPRESLDAVCIADLGFWGRAYLPYLPSGTSWTTGATASTAMMELSGGEVALPPVAMLIAWLYDRLSLANPALKGLADGFRMTGTGGQGQGTQRPWPLSQIFSEQVTMLLPEKAMGRGGRDWATYF